jgi:UTP:GlnB (protein PII) uridylyltransferase
VALAHPELTGREATNLVERRRMEAVRLAGEGTATAERIMAAPRSMLLSQPAVDIARQAAVLEPLPPKGSCRVEVTAGSALGRWRLYIGARDQRGLLATVTGALTSCDLTVLRAMAVTWGDGGALDVFEVSAADRPDKRAVQEQVERRFDVPLGSDPVPDAEVRFDDATPWYTSCEIRAPDRPGLLHSFAVAFAGADIDVHLAHVDTVDGRAVDRFDVTDRNGRRLDERRRNAVVDAIKGGVRPSRKARTKLAHSRNKSMTNVKSSLSTVGSSASDESRRHGCDDAEGGGRGSLPH